MILLNTLEFRFKSLDERIISIEAYDEVSNAWMTRDAHIVDDKVEYCLVEFAKVLDVRRFIRATEFNTLNSEWNYEELDSFAAAKKLFELGVPVEAFDNVPNEFYADLHTVDKLVDLLERLVAGENIEYDEINNEACDFLAGPNGTCNWYNANKLKRAGYDVSASEDRSGWLTGAIHINADDFLIFG